MYLFRMYAEEVTFSRTWVKRTFSLTKSEFHHEPEACWVDLFRLRDLGKCTTLSYFSNKFIRQFLFFQIKSTSLVSSRQMMFQRNTSRQNNTFKMFNQFNHFFILSKMISCHKALIMHTTRTGSSFFLLHDTVTAQRKYHPVKHHVKFLIAS